MDWTVLVSNQARAEDSRLSKIFQTGSGGSHCLLHNGNWVLPWGLSGRSLKLTAHLHLVRESMNEAINLVL
jgi:hypothetical protein